ncbi:MAG: hydroxymethylbilane synthase [Acidobacteria bacterium]|nr:hydroxymethylbilane synthase [Acidobacteriota bacterium]
MKLTIGTRGSQLALWQANWVKDQLNSAGHEVDIRIIKTTGDKLEQIPLTASGTKGLFIKEIEEALLAGSVELAVHSMKDLPADMPTGLIIAAVPKREDARDVLIAASGKRLGELQGGARVGTSSLRRQSQLRLLRSDLEIVSMRGNLDTRLRKLDRGDCEAVVLAAAGVHRLGWRARITEYFQASQICPAVGQGALAIQCREDDDKTVGAVKTLDDAPTHWAVRAERAMLRHMGGGCQVPIAAHAVAESGQLALQGVVAGLQGDIVIRSGGKDSIENAEGLGVRVAEDLLSQGAREILNSVDT